MLGARIELARVAPHAPQTCASTSSAIQPEKTHYYFAGEAVGEAAGDALVSAPLAGLAEAAGEAAGDAEGAAAGLVAGVGRGEAGPLSTTERVPNPGSEKSSARNIK